MTKLKFYYSVKITMNSHVHDHSYLLRCMPIETASQKLEECQFTMEPNQFPNKSMDAFGNRVLSGYITQAHRFLDFSVRGIAKRDDSQRRSDWMACYRYPSPMTKPDRALMEFLAQCQAETAEESDPLKQAEQWMHLLSERMQYAKNVTDVTTTAAQAFEMGMGVCQDYTHIFLSLLRQGGIPCRYIAGLAFEEGETHSWAEVWDGTHWNGFDPTNDKRTDERYLVLAQGRDSQDCTLNRGVMFGNYTQQMQLVESSIEELAF